MGGPTNPLLEEAALSTQIVAGKGDGGAAFALNRLAQQGDGRDRVLLNAFREIARLCELLNLNHTIKQRAQELFKQAAEVPATKVRGSGNNAVYAAVVYVACRQENAPRSFKELLAAIPGTGVKEVGKYYKKILKGLNLGADVGVVNVVDYLVRDGYFECGFSFPCSPATVWVQAWSVASGAQRGGAHRRCCMPQSMWVLCCCINHACCAGWCAP